MHLKLEVYQFLSRMDIDNRPLGKVNTYPNERMDLKFFFEFEIIDKPFEINFTQLIPKKTDAGAFQYIDPDVEVYMNKRWPKCIKGRGNVEVVKNEQTDNEILKFILQYMRVVCWYMKEYIPILKNDSDQFVMQKAYRREYYHHQFFDIRGKRRPNPDGNFYLTENGEFIGPGFATICDNLDVDNVNEFVWSEILPISNTTKGEKDTPKIRKKFAEIRKHYNSYNELNIARRLLSNNELKSSIRAAASSIDAILRYYCSLWEVPFPSKGYKFNEKIERVLKEASKPSYKSIDPINSNKLLYLYRARNSMHEGDCYYKDDSGNIIQIRQKKQVEEFVSAAEQFSLWIDSLV